MQTFKNILGMNILKNVYINTEFVNTIQSYVFTKP